MGTLRFTIGFLIAPLAIPLIELYPLLRLGGLAMQLLAVAYLIAAGAYVGTFLFGIPAYLLLHTRKWTAFWYAPVAGFAVAGLTWLFVQAVVTLVFGGPLFDVHSYLDWLRPVVWPYGTLGALVASFLWLLARLEPKDHRPA